MKTIEIQLYSFDELSASAQQKAIEKLSDINVDFNWWESTYEDAENVGLKITGFALDRNKHASGNFLNGAYDTALEIIDQHGENCETYKTAKEFFNFWDEAVKLHSDNVTTDKVKEGNEYYFDEYVEDKEDEFLKDILECYANILQNESEYLQSEEAIKETILSNEYDFTKDGSIY